MRGQHRLGPLQVGVAGQDHVAVPLGRRHEGPLQGRSGRASIRSSASRVQSLTSVATWSLRLRAVCSLRPTSPEPLDQGRLDVHVDVFALEDEREPSRLDLRPDFRQAPHNLLAFVGSDQTDMGEHLGVRDRAPDVVLEEPTIKGDRFRELFDAAVGPGVEPAAPGFLATLDTPCIRQRVRKLSARMS